MKSVESEKPVEFFPRDRHPNTLVPYPSWWRKLWCRAAGHNWKKFLWGGVDHMFDCDCCTRCFKFRGPLPIDRDTETFPCTMNPY